jgi:signal peptidase I
MPGLDSCGRCGTSLALATAVIDVHPPRASRRQLRVRKAVPRRMVYEARDAIQRARQAVGGSLVEDSRIPLPEPAILARLGIPGWAHFYSGLRIRGSFFLAGFLILEALGLSQWGTGEGSFFLGLAFSVHASSIIDILLRQGTVRFPRMFATAALVFLVLGVLVYLPAGQLLMRIAAPIEYTHDAPPFKRFDVVLVNRWAYALLNPRRGDIVLMSPLHTTRLIHGNQAAHVRYAFEENEVIDRLIGLPGDRVVWDSGAYTINGGRVSWKSLLSERLPNHLEWTVPPDRYLIVPTTSVGAIGSADPHAFWAHASLIPRHDLLGGVYLRLNPISRLWFIR